MNVDRVETIPTSVCAKGAKRLPRRIYHSGPAVTYNARPVARNVRPVPQPRSWSRLIGSTPLAPALRVPRRRDREHQDRRGAEGDHVHVQPPHQSELHRQTERETAAVTGTAAG